MKRKGLAGWRPCHPIDPDQRVAHTANLTPSTHPPPGHLIIVRNTVDLGKGLSENNPEKPTCTIHTRSTIYIEIIKAFT